MRTADTSTTGPPEAPPDPVAVVVVGHGMVGSRFVEELLDRDPEGRFAITVLGAEEYEPYNRVLLSDLVAGTVTMGSLTLPAPARPDRRPVTVLRGTRAIALDRGARQVRCSDATVVPYDLLVLATGARARIPAIDGLTPTADAPGTGALPRGAHVLRSMDDARAIVAGTLNATSAVVLGGGVLGLEVAAGLARRGVPTTVVHAATALMERQLDEDASDVVAGRLRALGIHTELAAATQAVLVGEDRVTGLRLGDGREVAADLVVLSCGTIPESALAEAAGMAVGPGVVVGADLAAPDDPRVFAIGDCASPPQGGTGLIAQGWDQARRLAALLAQRHLPGAAAADACLEAPAADPSTDVVRVKGAGLDVVTMGACGRARGTDTEDRVIRLSDPRAGRLVEVVVRADRVVGATCVGAGHVAADLTAAYTRGTPVPADPAHLVLRPVGPAQTTTASPTNMPSSMTVCRCNGVTKADVVRGFLAGGRTTGDIAARTRATTGCGGCSGVVDGLLEWLRTSDSEARDQPTSQPATHTGEHDVLDLKHDTNHPETARP